MYEDLNKIDWNFSDAPQESPSKLHPYPARFIECIPRTLIQVLGVPKDSVIFDPFCGSGTTLFEAQCLGYDSIGVDLNPIACLLSKVKTRNLPFSFVQAYLMVHTKAVSAYRRNQCVPVIPNLDHWFKKDVQIAISTIISEIATQEDEDTKEALQLALSSIIVRVSNQDSDTRYASVEKCITAEDVYNHFLNACEKMIQNKPEISTGATATIINKDILSITKSDIGTNIGLVITSPPYPNAYEYWLYHKYRMWWLGFDPIKVRSSEIGARPHYQKKNGQTEVDFSLQMNKLFTLFDTCVLKGGHICIVIGRSIIKGRVIDNAGIISNLANEHGYSKVANIERNISATRKSFNPRYGKINSENILVFRKDK
ncbi:MAG: site-specific DNA-methyltransferase [Defluviitaleaceae bacterium]|nr:site-specific DNA-methyltransferase [Defluviitaleaceae bacterium]